MEQQDVSSLTEEEKQTFLDQLSVKEILKETSYFAEITGTLIDNITSKINKIFENLDQEEHPPLDLNDEKKIEFGELLIDKLIQKYRQYIGYLEKKIEINTQAITQTEKKKKNSQTNKSEKVFSDKKQIDYQLEEYQNLLNQNQYRLKRMKDAISTLEEMKNSIDSILENTPES